MTGLHSLLTIHSKHPKIISMTAMMAAPMHAKMPAMQDTMRLHTTLSKSPLQEKSDCVHTPFSVYPSVTEQLSR